MRQQMQGVYAVRVHFPRHHNLYGKREYPFHIVQAAALVQNFRAKPFQPFKHLPWMAAAKQGSGQFLRRYLVDCFPQSLIEAGVAHTFEKTVNRQRFFRGLVLYHIVCPEQPSKEVVNPDIPLLLDNQHIHQQSLFGQFMFRLKGQVRFPLPQFQFNSAVKSGVPQYFFCRFHVVCLSPLYVPQWKSPSHFTIYL